jgi:hypothetical protein
MSDGFLGRWSRRKQDVREGRPPVEPVESVAPAAPALPAVARPPAGPRGPAAREAPSPASALAAQPAAPAAPPVEVPAPTLADARELTPASDFKPFMARGVAPDVRNAAMKKLFADPHFNVMDRLDTYIDDYGQPDPLPAALLRQMASARFLKLVDEEAPASAPAGTAAAQDVAQSGLPPELPPPPPGAAPVPTEPENAHPDLRLQPDHAPQRESAGPGPA